MRYLLMLLLLSACGTGTHADAGQPTVAITIDDLPMTSAYLRTESQLEGMTYRLLAKIRLAKVPVTPFVNESGAHAGKHTAPGRTDWLERWAAATRAMGNHTYSHVDLERHGVEAFLEDITKGELITERLMGDFDIKEKFFRHPYLHMGRTLDEKRQVDAFLHRKGYRIAPVTINPDDTAFASLYDMAELYDNQPEMDRIGEAYLVHLAKTIDVSHGLSMSIFKRDIPEILLIHANALNIRYFQEVVALFWNKGYRIVPLGEALEDPAYGTPDVTYTPGNPWLMQRMWAAAVAPQVRIPPPLQLPDFVRNAYLSDGALPESARGQAAQKGKEQLRYKGKH